ncbi:chromosome condensation regulation protein [Chloropicon primus]|nr:chromosome condensation regulation protein [Chloropicon primus]
MQVEEVSLKFYACGRNDLGQLGELSRDNVYQPQELERLENFDAIDLVGGKNNSAAVTGRGDIVLCGENDSGQLGSRQRSRQQTAQDFGFVDLPGDSHISTISCGDSHVIALSNTGGLVSWGAAEYGQLGHGESKNCVDTLPLPRRIEELNTVRFIQVSCGANHTVALSSTGRVYSFGLGTCGALGLGSRKNRHTPTPINSLQAAALVQVAAGENHSCALGMDGKVYAWGKGRYGQLGNGRFGYSLSPAHVSKLREPVKMIASGSDQIFAITWNGVLFSWGRGSWGQTGLGTTDNVASPRKVVGLGNDIIIQVTSGEKHTLILTETNKVYAVGNGRYGQLGIGKSINFTSKPVPITTLPESHLVVKVVAGGDHSLFITFPFDLSNGGRGGARASSSKLLLCKQFQKVYHQKCIPFARIPSISYLLSEVNKSSSEEGLSTLVNCIEDIFSSPGFLVSGFARHQDALSVSHNLELSSIESIYSRLLVEAEKHEIITKVLVSSIKNCLLLIESNLLSAKASKQGLTNKNGTNENIQHLHFGTFLRSLLIVMQNPLFANCAPRFKNAVSTLQFHVVKIIANLPENLQRVLAEWMSEYPSEIFSKQFVQPVQQFLSAHVQSNLDDPAGGMWNDVSKAAIQVLVMMHAANESAGGTLISFQKFYNIDLSHTVNLRDHYINWIQLGEFEATHGPLVSLCQVPFIMTTEAKVRILQGESNLQKRNEMRNSHLMAVYEGREDWSEFCELRVTRENLVQDAIEQVIMRTQDMKKPLRVAFTTAGVEEEGLDEGGVTKEFFQLLVRQLFNADYGMFTYKEDSHTYWFNMASPACDLEFQLVGILLGLAIYNGVILDIRFPKFLYKKLKGLRADFSDLEEAAPNLAKQLQYLLQYEGDIESTFSLYFVTEYEYYGKMKQYDLIPNGSCVAVTSENREQYVELYTNFLLEESIASQFNAFSQGFHQVCGGPALALFRPEELELLVCGQPSLDFGALELSTHYDAGYTNDSPIVKAFWEIIYSMEFNQQKKFLFFVTGCNRAPVGGLGRLGFTIQRSGPDTEYLPTSHTCFNILLLPEYSSKEKLETKLLIAIANGEGFGLQ